MFPKINEQYLSKRDQDHSRPSDLGKVARRLAVKRFDISKFRVFEVLRRGIAEVTKS
jgi:hypothetical protein